MDNLVRMGLHEEVGDQAPSPGTRDALLAAAAGTTKRSTLGPSVPPIVAELREAGHEDKVYQQSLELSFSVRSLESRWLLMVAPLAVIR